MLNAMTLIFHAANLIPDFGLGMVQHPPHSRTVSMKRLANTDCVPLQPTLMSGKFSPPVN